MCSGVTNSSQDFYKDDLYYVNLKFIYVNRENEIEKINQESFLMSNPNYISREEIIQINVVSGSKICLVGSWRSLV